MLRVILIIGLVVTSCSLVAQESSTVSDSVSDTLRAILAARQGIHSGHFIATGMFAGGPATRWLQREVWFSTDHWRVDLAAADSDNHPPHASRLNQLQRTIIKRGSTYFIESNGVTAVANDELATREAIFFDIRSVGLADAYDMKRAAPIDEIVQVLNNSGIPIGLERLAGGLLQLVRGPLPDGGMQVITIDPFRGFVPLESRLLHGPGNEQLIQSAWEKVDEVWVPTRVKVKSRQVIKVDLQFDWKSVNSQFRSDLFEPAFQRK